jgi:hypothetical protein
MRGNHKPRHTRRQNPTPYRLILRLFDYASCVELFVTRLALLAIFLYGVYELWRAMVTRRG